MDTLVIFVMAVISLTVVVGSPINTAGGAVCTASHTEVSIETFVGQRIEHRIPCKDRMRNEQSDVPDWIAVQGKRIVGIPGPEDVGTTNFTITRGIHTTMFKVTVVTETFDKCGGGPAYWLETFWHFPPTLYNMLGVADLIRSQNLWDHVNATLRIFPFAYGNKIRELEYVEHAMEYDGTFMAVWQATCSDSKEEALKLRDQYLSLPDVPTREVRLSKGVYRNMARSRIASNGTTIETPTRPSTETTSLLSGLSTGPSTSPSENVSTRSSTSSSNTLSTGLSTESPTESSNRFSTGLPTWPSSSTSTTPSITPDPTSSPPSTTLATAPTVAPSTTTQSTTTSFDVPTISPTTTIYETTPSPPCFLDNLKAVFMNLGQNFRDIFR